MEMMLLRDLLNVAPQTARPFHLAWLLMFWMGVSRLKACAVRGMVRVDGFRQGLVRFVGIHLSTWMGLSVGYMQGLCWEVRCFLWWRFGVCGGLGLWFVWLMGAGRLF